MHILFIPSWYPVSRSDVGGSFFREQAQALHKQGCQVGVIYPHFSSLRNGIFAKEKHGNPEFEIDEGIFTYRYYGKNWFPRFPAGIKRLWEYFGIQLFEKYIRTHGLPEIVHVHSMLYAGVVALRVKSRYGIPYVVTEHSSAFARGGVTNSSLGIAEKIQHGAARAFSVSKSFSTNLDKRLPRENVPWGVVPNIVSQKFLDAPIKKIKDSQGFVFLNVALMNKNKNQKNIIKAFAKYFSKSVHVSLVIGGHGNEMNALKGLAENLGVAARVKFPGMLSRSQVLEAMSTADAFILSSDYETFGVVLVEALALGKPVIATRCGGPQSIVEEGDGILVDVDDVDELGRAMVRLNTEYSVFNSHEIRVRCIERYSEPVIAESLIKIYTSVISKDPNSSRSLNGLSVA